MKIFCVKISVFVITFLFGLLISLPYKRSSTFLAPTRTILTLQDSSLKIQREKSKEKIRIEVQGYRKIATQFFISYWLINDTKEPLYYFGFSDGPCAMVEHNNSKYGQLCKCTSGAKTQRLRAGQSILFEIPFFPTSDSIRLNLDISIGRTGEKRTVKSDEVFFQIEN